MRSMLSVSLLLALAACVSPEEQRAMDTDRCMGFGFRVGSNAFSNCMMQIGLDRDAQEAANNRAFSAQARADAAADQAREDRRRAERAERRAREEREQADRIKLQLSQ